MRVLTALMATLVIGTLGCAGPGPTRQVSTTNIANAKPPTNGGNGAGQSGQCTGPADERPGGCHTSK